MSGERGTKPQLEIQAAKVRVEMAGAVAHLLLDDPDSKVNTLGVSALREIGLALESLAGDPAVRAIVIRSPKASGFLAGANLDEMREVSASDQARARGREFAREGQSLMSRIEACRKPVVAAIHGVCLGGGLELAMACHARVASNEPGTQLGLPELKLGIIPGFGGTVRMIRLLGLPQAMEWTLSSRVADGRKAFRSGLVDDTCALLDLPRVGGELALSLMDPGVLFRLQRARRRKVPPLQRLLSLFPLSKAAVAMARRQALRKSGGHYPAVSAYLDVAGSHGGASNPQAYALEAEAVGRLLEGPESRNLIRLFFLGQDSKKTGPSAEARPLRETGVVGSGFMGAGIATVLVSKAGLRCVIKDVEEKMVGRALKKAYGHLEEQSRKKRLDPAEARRRFFLLSGVTEDSGLRSADLVIEAVPEILDLKRRVFAGLESVLGPEAIIASNTSTLPIADLALGARRPERIIGMHFFSPVEKMPLVEIIPGPATSPQTVATTLEAARKMGKTPVLVRDSTGFLVNRVLLPYMLEALLLLEEGVPLERVEKAAIHFGMPLGPVKLVGEVGASVAVKACEVLLKVFGEHLAGPKMITRTDFDKLFVKAVGRTRVDETVLRSFVNRPDPGLREDAVQDRLFHAMLLEAIRCLEEKIVADAGTLDLAMVYGTGFPPFRGGPLRWADELGAPKVELMSRSLASRFGPRFLPPALLTEKATKKESFHTPPESASPR